MQRDRGSFSQRHERWWWSGKGAGEAIGMWNRGVAAVKCNSAQSGCYYAVCKLRVDSEEWGEVAHGLVVTTQRIPAALAARRPERPEWGRRMRPQEPRAIHCRGRHSYGEGTTRCGTGQIVLLSVREAEAEANDGG